MKWVRTSAVAAVCLMAGCSLFNKPVEQPMIVEATRPHVPLHVKALPVCRLTFDQTVADLPSRLIALHAQIENLDQGMVRFTPQDVTLNLPNGTTVRPFDRTRARVLLDRLGVGAWDLSYVSDPARPYPAGGLSELGKQELKEKLRAALLDEENIFPGHPIQGYLIVDLGMPRISLEGASLEVVVGVAGNEPVRGTYQFAANSGGLQVP